MFGVFVKRGYDSKFRCESKHHTKRAAQKEAAKWRRDRPGPYSGRVSVRKLGRKK